MTKNNNVNQSYSKKSVSKEDEYLEDSQDNDDYSDKKMGKFSKNNEDNSKY